MNNTTSKNAVGRPLRFKEQTKRVYFTVPRSKVATFQKSVEKILATYIKGSR